MSIVVTRYGAAAPEALRAAIAELRGTDPLAPVEVAVPSAFVGATVRRRLAQPGLAGVRFAPLPRLIADRARAGLAAAGLVPLTPAQRRAATRAVLTRSAGRLAESSRKASGTAEVLSGVFAGNLDDLGDGPGVLAALAASEGRPAEVGMLYGEYLRIVADAAGPERTAAAALAARVQTPLVVYLPRRLGPAELRFCAALEGRGLLRVVLGRTGPDESVDRDALAILAALAPDARTNVPFAPALRVETRTLPDADEEARFAVRRVLDHLERHPDARADRIGIAYRAASPYARLVAEALTAAGVPYHAPRQRTLAQTAAGRTLLGLLGLPDEQFSRTAVFDWLGDAPVRDGQGYLPVATWAKRAGEAGVTQGQISQWTTKLTRFAERVESTPPAEGAQWRARHAAEARALAAFVTDAAARVQAVEGAGTWAEAAGRLRAVLEHHLGGAQAAARWGGHAVSLDRDVQARCDVERDAYAQTVAVVDRLARLDEIAVAFHRDALFDVLTQELGATVREARGLARGVLVGPGWDLAGADLDLLVVLGATEGSYPPRGREHPVLRDGLREQLGLRTLADRRAGERRDHLALLASARTVVLTHPLTDARAQRGAEPSPWLLEATEPRRTSNKQKESAPASFQASVCDLALPALSASEFDVRLAMAAAPLRPGHALLSADETLERGIAAALARTGGVFGPWTAGLTHPVPAPVTARIDRTLSATSLQQYAHCPFQYYLRYVLGVVALEEPDSDVVDSAERGSVAHEVMELLVAAAMERGKPPAEPWTEAEHAEAQRLLGERADRMLAEGKAGRPTPWAVHVERWRRRLRQVLHRDDLYRATIGAQALGVEHYFGGEDPLVVDLPSGQVRLSGSIDRVDSSADGGLVVLDYKTGRSASYEKAFPLDGAAVGLATDLTGRGTKLQLPLYALAARRDFGDEATPVSGYYAFLDEGGARRGGHIDGAAVDRFHDVLDTVAAGIRDGAFPARPGDFNSFFRSFDSCGFCDFDRVCSTARDDEWERVRDHERVLRYADLAEPSENQS